jgi:4-azaleucine resistance transporter AzlC
VNAPARRDITRRALAIGAATGIYGISFGVLSVAAGLSPAQTCAMSLLVFTGASQFATVGVIAAGGSAAAALAPALLLAARNGVYGLSLVPVLRGRLASRALQAQLVIDESTAMARAQDDAAAAHRAFLATGLSVFLFWNLGTLAGAIAGSGLGDPRRLGLDAMFPAAFLALLAPQLRRPGGGRLRRAAGDGPGAVRPGRRADPVLRVRRDPGPDRAAARAGGGMSWTALLALAAGAYVLKAVGPVVVGNRQLPTDVTQALELLSVPLVAALVAVQTLDGGGKLVLDARVPALAVAAVLVWRKAPFPVVLLAAAATAALLRL